MLRDISKNVNNLVDESSHLYWSSTYDRESDPNKDNINPLLRSFEYLIYESNGVLFLSGALSVKPEYKDHDDQISLLTKDWYYDNGSNYGIIIVKNYLPSRFNGFSCVARVPVEFNKSGSPMTCKFTIKDNNLCINTYINCRYIQINNKELYGVLIQKEKKKI